MLRAMNWKKIAMIAIAAFLVYFLVRSPVESATTVKSIAVSVGGFANRLATALTTFLQTLF